MFIQFQTEVSFAQLQCVVLPFLCQVAYINIPFKGDSDQQSLSFLSTVPQREVIENVPKIVNFLDDAQAYALVNSECHPEDHCQNCPELLLQCQSSMFACSIRAVYVLLSPRCCLRPLLSSFAIKYHCNTVVLSVPVPLGGHSLCRLKLGPVVYHPTRLTEQFVLWIMPLRFLLLPQLACLICLDQCGLHTGRECRKGY